MESFAGTAVSQSATRAKVQGGYSLSEWRGLRASATLGAGDAMAMGAKGVALSACIVAGV
jgi:hypothetical protein